MGDDPYAGLGVLGPLAGVIGVVEGRDGGWVAVAEAQSGRAHAGDGGLVHVAAAVIDRHPEGGGGVIAGVGGVVADIAAVEAVAVGLVADIADGGIVDG